MWKNVTATTCQWQTAVRIPNPVNSDRAEWLPRPAADGWLYFGSNRIGGHGKNDMWRARESTPGRWVVENLGTAINNPDDKYEPLLSSAGKRLIVEASDGLYASTRIEERWSPRARIQSNVNANGTEIGALFSPSGRSMLFARDTGESKSGEFFIWRIDGQEACWPPGAAARNHRAARK